MHKTIFPEGYAPSLTIKETQFAIDFIKKTFSDNLAEALNLHRASAPLFVTEESGLNDNLNGVERPVEFDVPYVGKNVQIVHSLAKWKRMALYRYGFSVGEGIYTDMNAVRRDEELDNIHSVYVDQWDWEKVISREMRTREYLEETVRKIVGALADTAEAVVKEFPKLDYVVSRDVFFITTQELEDMYPDLTPKEREHKITEDHRTVFIMQIGGKLRSGIKHDGRAPDYDDWALNGDIIVRNDVLGISYEISSMGIRVDAESLLRQLDEAGVPERKELPFHKALIEGKYPLTIGGGIGQSRMCMLLLKNAHIGEVQSSVWDDETAAAAENAGIELL